jgi:hypothetical protein
MYVDALDFYRSALDKNHKEYLKQRGISDEYIDLFKIGFCPPKNLPVYRNAAAIDSGLYRTDGVPSLSERIIFPYIAYNEVTDMRGRCLDDQEPKYKSPFNQSYARGAIYPFNFNRATEKSKETKTIVITEGEIKALVGDQFGFAVVGLPGMTNWRSGFIDGYNDVFGIRIVVVFDNSVQLDDKIRIDRAIKKLTNHLPCFYVGVLPLLGEHKMDIDTFLLHKNGGERRFKDIIDESIPYERYKALRRF